MRSLAVPAIAIGIFDAVAGFYMAFGWPMTGFGTAYNMLFGDPLLLAGLILVMGGIMGYRDPEHIQRTEQICGRAILTPKYGKG